MDNNKNKINGSRDICYCQCDCVVRSVNVTNMASIVRSQLLRSTMNTLLLRKGPPLVSVSPDPLVEHRPPRI